MSGRCLTGPGVAVLLAACRGLVLGEDAGRDPSAFFKLQPLGFGPGAYLGAADAGRGSLAAILSCPPGGAGYLPAGVGVASQGRPQVLGVLRAQVNLVVHAVQTE